jgi:NAD(P)-dependent dehydrogenase (short-subunit alcohol dehydrogenase family)
LEELGINERSSIKMGRLDGKVAVITGGNSGIGEATVKLFAKEGARVVITARREAELKRVADEIKAQGGTVMYVPGDVRVTADVDRVIEETVKAFGTIDILVNNAGIGDKHIPTVKLSDEWMEEVIDTDLKGVIRFCRAALRHMEKAGHGVIVNVASIGGVYGCAGASYSAAKNGVIALTKNIAIQYHARGIRANSISPGSTLTPLFDPEKFEGADEEMIELTKRVHVHEYEDMIPPEQQASVILFLASDESQAVNGQDIVVDRGGRL